MIVLTRKNGEGVVLEHGGERVVIGVFKRDGEVKLYLDAPRSFEIDRAESLGVKVPKGPQRPPRKTACKATPPAPPRFLANQETAIFRHP